LDETVRRVVELYKNHVTVKEICKLGICSEAKARKILVSEGLYKSPRADEIKKMIEGGFDVPQIAKKLGVTEKAVNAFLPYTKGMYMRDNPTRNALVIRELRAKGLVE